MSTGLIIGKFMPPHRGHQFLIETAARQVDRLTIILFTKQDEPIPGHLRLEWLRSIAGRHRVVRITDEHPVDFEDATVWDRWLESIRRICQTGPDRVFSSELYGEQLARLLGARHIMVDHDRKRFPVGARKIRSQPWRYWDFIIEAARPYFVQRVAVVGAECTGKTTLARELAEHFRTIWVPEFARSYLESRGGTCAWEDMVRIAHGQMQAEDEAIGRANRLLFCDTDLLTTSLWSHHYFKKCDIEIMANANAREFALTLLLAPDLPWVNDGLRDCPSLKDRKWFHARLREGLEKRKRRFAEITGQEDERLRNALQAIKTAFPGLTSGDHTRNGGVG